MNESQILCEGYYDRAFWAGWLKHLGCIDPGVPSTGSSHRRPVLDPWKTPVTRGQFAYHSKTGHFLRVVPCGGKDNILPIAAIRLKKRTSEPILRLVINVDADTTASGVHTKTGLRAQDVEQFVRNQVDPSATMNAAGEIAIDGGNTLVCLIRWEVADSPDPALPDQQTLERLACAAIVAAYPARKPAVASWLNLRPAPPVANPKDHAWSYMAGWYAENSCDNFYSHLWDDPAIRTELETRLRASSAWQIAATLTQ